MASYRRGYNWELIESFPAPIRGLDRTTPPTLMSPEYSPGLVNFIPSDGCIIPRGPIKGAWPSSGVLNGGSSYSLAGAWPRGSGFFTVSRRNATVNQFVEPWNVALQQPVSANQLVTGSTAGFNITPSSGALGMTFASADAIPGIAYARHAGLIYGPSFDSVAAATAVGPTGYFVKPTPLMSMAGDVGSQTSTVYTHAPHAGIAVCSYLDCLFILGGINTPGGASAYNPNTLFFTNPTPGTALVDTNAQWTDPSSGLVNQIVIDSDDNDYGVALARSRYGLVIFKSRSIYVLRGGTPSAFQVQLVSREAGAIDQRAVIETDKGVYFMSLAGLMLTDGVRVRNVSGAMQHYLSLAAAQYRNTLATSSGRPYMSMVQLASGNLMLSIGQLSTGTTVAPTPFCTLHYNVTTGAWTEIQSHVWQVNNLLTSYPFGGVLVGQSGQRVLCLDETAATLVEDVSYNGFGLDTAWGAQLNDTLVGGTTFPLSPLNWFTPLLRMANPGKRGQLKRTMIDYLFQTNGGPSQWVLQVSLFDQNATTLLQAQVPALNTTIGGDSILGLTPFVRQQHMTFDVSNEAENIYALVQLASATGAVPNLTQIHGLHFEFQPTSDRRGP